MYISKIRIKNFRNFKDHEILFNDGINVIIGHNNSGKSNALRALSLVIDTQTSKRLNVHDFNKNISIDELKKASPKVSISVYISESDNENLYSDDLVTVSNFLIKLESPYEALLTYEFYLPENEEQKYLNTVSTAKNTKEAWKIIQQDFLRLYISKIYGGEPELKQQADSESLQKFDFQFLDAIRDVERDMFSGRNTLLKEVLDFFMDYELKNNGAKTEDERLGEIRKLKEEFHSSADLLIGKLQERMEKGKKEILEYAKETGASSFNNAVPDFEGSLSDIELFSALRLVIKDKGETTIPITHNGLGYNNLIFISLLLAKMQATSDGKYLGGNAKVFPILVIEEPEAHLHPAMQYKFLKFLNEIKNKKGKVRQIFITTHSTQITSAVSLDEIICLHVDENNLYIGYPGKVFTNTKEDHISKAYVQRFLDATKSDMLFAAKIIFVEGIAEELLLPTFAKYCGKSLEDSHVTVINVGGRYFEHFIKLFDTRNEHAIHKKIACLTDRDPSRREKKANQNYKKCYPYEYGKDMDNYEYAENANNNIENFKEHENIHFFSQDEVAGKTFEYDIVFNNSKLEILMTDSMQNRDEILEMMRSESYEQALEKLKNNEENRRIKESLSASDWNDEDKKKSLIASRYLNSIGKGENALELCEQLEENFSREENNKQKFNVPPYIKDAFEWVLK